MLLGLSAPDVEWVVHFNFRNARPEKTHYRSGGPIAAFVLAAVGIRGDNHQDGGGDKTATDHGVSHIRDRTPFIIALQLSQANDKVPRVFWLPALVPAPS